MTRLFGRDYTKANLLPYVGNMQQLGGATLLELSDGPERGVRVAEVSTGAGLTYTVLLDRGMDISRATIRGVPLAWLSPRGAASAAFYDPAGIGWLRNFPGGLLTTCGLTYLGAICQDGQAALGVHGRVSNTPASDIAVHQEWDGDEYTIRVSGTVREWQLFSENVAMRRTITSRLGRNSVLIEDAVTNDGYETVPHMILYHANFGWPIVSPDSRLEIGGTRAIPRDGDAANGVADWAVMDEPTPHYREKVYYHEAPPDSHGLVTVRLTNPTLTGADGAAGLGVYLRYRKTDCSGVTGLNTLVQWKQMGQGAYVLGIEPANCRVDGRAKERERGTLQFLEPGESRRYSVEIGECG